MLMKPVVTLSGQGVLPATRGALGKINAKTSIEQRVLKEPNATMTDLGERVFLAALKGLEENPQFLNLTPSLTPDQFEARIKRWASKFKPRERERMVDLASKATRGALDPEWNLQHRTTIRNFLKVEDMGKPRNISPMSPEVKAILGPICEIVDKAYQQVRCQFNVKGKTVGEMVRAVESIQTTTMTEVDIVKMDKHVRIRHLSPWAEMHVRVARRVAGELYATQVAKAFAAILKARHVHVSGWIYWVEAQLDSGRPDTSSLDSFIGDTASTLAIKLDEDLEGEDVVQAVYEDFNQPDVDENEVPGRKGLGDDLIMSGDRADTCVAAYNHLGFEVEAVSLPAPISSFLNRNIYRGMQVCNLARALRKFHFSARPPGRNGTQDLLVAKCLSYLVTDYYTPVLGAICWAICNRSEQWTSTRAATNLYKYRLASGDLDLKWIARAGPPSFCPMRATLVCLQGDFTMSVLKRSHLSWLDYGMGGSFPDPIHLTETKHRCDQTDV